MQTKIALTLCSSLALVSCGEPIKVNTPPPPAEWLQCEAEPDRPNLAPLVTYAKPEVDARDSLIARYLLALRAAHFDCANNLAMVKDYYREAE